MYKLFLKDFKNFDTEKLILLDTILIQSDFEQYKNYFLALLNRIICKRVNLSLSCGKNTNVLFLKSYSSERKDHQVSFSNIVNTAGDPSILHQEETKQIDLVRSIKIIYGLLLLSFQMRNRYVGTRKIALLKAFVVLNDYMNAINNIDIGNPKLAVVYYDACLMDYIFVTHMKSKGIKTATLQHAAFIAARDVASDNFEFKGMELSNSTADYFLAWNPFTRDEAIKAGISKDKIKVMGIPKYCYYQENGEVSTEEHGCFGVALNAMSFDSLNRKLIEAANYLARETGLKFYIKYHPQYKDFIYDDLCDTNYFLGHFELDTPVKDYINKVDFSLISNSSVFIEFVFLKHKVYRLQADELDKFNTIKTDMFRTNEELKHLVVKIEQNTSNTLFDILCYTTSPEANYKLFFDSFCGLM